MRFADPAFLLCLFLLVPLGWLFFSGRQRGRLQAPYPSFGVLGSLSGAGRVWLSWAPAVFRLLALGLLGVALARPQTGHTEVKKSTEGLDIVLVVDTSKSMAARDFVVEGKRPSRLSVVKGVMRDFIKDRPSDRIGMVVFGTRAFTQAPLTLDHPILLDFLDRVEVSMAGDATAIGDGIATAVKRLRDTEAQSKIAILLTDGSQTAGRVDPLKAAETAKAFGVKLYTIGAGSEGAVPVVVGGRVRTRKVNIDEKLLKKMAKITGGEYYRATDTESLVDIYETIDELEKTERKVEHYGNYDERYRPFAAAALGLLVLEILLGLTRFRRIP